MKYTINSRGQLLYRRRWPSRLMSHPQCIGEFYTKSLGVKTSSSDEDKLRAWQKVHEDYEDFIKGLSLANVAVLEAVEAYPIAKATLRAKGLEPGMLAKNELLSEKEQEVVQDEAWRRVLDSGVLDPVHDIDKKEHYGTELTAGQKIAEKAYKLLTEPKSSPLSYVLLLSDC